MTLIIEPLPFAPGELSPGISEQTVTTHYEKHQRGYLAALNGLVKGTRHQSQSLEDIVLTGRGPIFNNASQAWNHALYWRSLSPDKSMIGNPLLSTLVASQFGSLKGLLEVMNQTAQAFFGSGWLWLSISNSDALHVEALANAENPLTRSLHPLLTIDLWEHAYYLDYKNERTRYIEAALQLVDWRNATHRFESRPWKSSLKTGTRSSEDSDSSQSSVPQ